MKMWSIILIFGAMGSHLGSMVAQRYDAAALYLIAAAIASLSASQVKP